MKMRKNADSSNECFAHSVRASLGTIKDTHVQLHTLTGTSATAALLASQIELYELLLDEISGIHNSLARDLKRTRFSPQVSVRRSFDA